MIWGSLCYFSYSLHTEILLFFCVHTSIWSKPFYVQHKKRYERNNTQPGWIYLQVSYLDSSESGKLSGKQRKVLIYQFLFAISLFGLIPGLGFVWCFIWGVFLAGRGVCDSGNKKVETKMIKMNLGVRWGNSKLCKTTGNWCIHHSTFTTLILLHLTGQK